MSQAATEVMASIEPLLEREPHYYQTFLRMLEPERVISFRVPWVNDDGAIQVNRGYRVQMNSALGPYKGGLRLHRDVDQSTLKFLAFEQTFKVSTALDEASSSFLYLLVFRVRRACLIATTSPVSPID